MKQQRVKYWGHTIDWRFNGEWHRDGDLPARYGFVGGKLVAIAYHKNGPFHCPTGPAHTNYQSKIKEYFYQGRKYASFEEMMMVEACR